MKKRMSGVGRLYSAVILVTLLLCLISAPQPASAANKTLAAPSAVKAVSSSYNSIKISWGSVSGATGYRVYRAESKSGSYKLIKTTTAKSYKDTGLTTGTTYYYKVRAYVTSGSSKTYGVYSKVISAKPVPATPASPAATSSSYNSIKISWSSVSGASGYRVYRATSSTGTYKLVKTTSSKSYTDTELTTGKNYYYKIRAYKTVNGSKVFGSYTAVMKAGPVPSVPISLQAIYSVDGVVILTWNETEGTDGYEVYKAAASDGAYELLAAVTTAEYSDIGEMAETTCYYKVRAFKIVDGKTVYGSDTDIVSAMIPTVNVSSISLDKNEVTLVMGGAEQLTPTIAPENAANQAVTWQSSDESVATVDEKGNIISVNPGTAIITATTSDGGYICECEVTVINAQIKGIDVSKWQQTIKWDLVKNDGIEFAMIRSSYGSSSVDPMFETNYKSARDNGVAVGAYHYSYATTVKKAAAELEFLISNLEGKQFEYPICVDIEDSSMSTLDKATLTDIALVYLKGLKDAGYYPIIYSNRTWFTLKLDDTRLVDYDHWLAQWGTSITYTGKVGIWQYSSTGSVKGISGNVDLDISFIDYAAMIKRLGLNGF